MDKIEVKIVSFKPVSMTTNVRARCEEQMQECFNDGFLLMRADTTNDSVVYIFTRTVKAR